MEILFPCQSNPYFDSSAIGNRYESLLNGLLENDTEITILVVGGYNSWEEFFSKGFKKTNHNLKIRYAIFTFQNNLWLRRFNNYILSPLFELILAAKLKHEYRKPFDFLWLTGNLTVRKSFLSNMKLIKAKSKILIELSEFQELNKLEYSPNKSLKSKREIKYTEVTFKALHHIDCFAIITKTLIEYYKGLTNNKDANFLHLPMTVDIERFKDIPNSLFWKKPYIAFIGTYTNQKDGVDILLESFGKIASEFPEYHLYLAGFYHPDVTIQIEIISRLSLKDRVTYIGVLNKNIIPIFIGNAKLLVLSRPDSRQAQGGFPTKLGEYLATGNPVCSTRVGEIPDYLTDNESVFFAEPGSIDSFAEAMIRALSDPENARRVGLNGRKVAEEHFSMDVQAKRLYEFLNENIDGKIG